MRAKLTLLGRDIGWLVAAGGGLHLQPAAAPADWAAQGGTPERWRHYALQMLLREAYDLGPGEAQGARWLEAKAAADPRLTVEGGGPLPGGLPAGATVAEMTADGNDDEDEPEPGGRGGAERYAAEGEGPHEPADTHELPAETKKAVGGLGHMASLRSPHQPPSFAAPAASPKPPAPAAHWPAWHAGPNPFVEHVRNLPPPARDNDYWPHLVAGALEDFTSRGHVMPDFSDYLHARHAAGDLPRTGAEAAQLARLAADAAEIGGPHRAHFADQSLPVAEALRRHGGYVTRLRRPEDDEDPEHAEGGPVHGHYVPRGAGGRHEWFFEDTVPDDEPLGTAVAWDATHTLPQHLPGSTDTPGARPTGAHPPGRLQNRELTPLERVLAGIDPVPGLDRDDPTYRGLLDAYRHGEPGAAGALADHLKEGGAVAYRRDRERPAGRAGSAARGSAPAGD